MHNCETVKANLNNENISFELKPILIEGVAKNKHVDIEELKKIRIKGLPAILKPKVK